MAIQWVGQLEPCHYSRGGCPSGGSGIAQGGAGNCATTPNTCVERCVPAGQVTLKGKCPLATSGPNAGQRVSDGVCDCDLDEWASPPPNSSQVGRVSLNFLDNGQYIDGRTTE